MAVLCFILTSSAVCPFFLTADQPYIRLSPQLSPRLAHKGLSVQVNEGEDLELSVVIEAYPRISEHRWDTPTSPNATAQDQKFTRYNNRYTGTRVCDSGDSVELSGGGRMLYHGGVCVNCCVCVCVCVCVCLCACMVVCVCVCVCVG